MKTKLFIISFFLILLTASTSASVKLSKDATISILTCSPGNELYSLFGHTGIRVVDKANNMDIVFNYGTFDFATQGFYFKFARWTTSLPIIVFRVPSFFIVLHSRRA